MKSMSIEIKTLTPIWTGDVNGECEKIKETSIIGGIRWWYEAIVRGMGGYACNPVTDGCEFNTKGYEDALNYGKSIEDALTIGLKEVCPACQLFGCTGWKRKFRMDIDKIDSVGLNFINKFDDGDFSNINTRWWLKKTLKENPRAFYSSDAFSVKLLADNEESKNKILALFKLIENIGTFGAKAQNGFGIVEVIHSGQLEKLSIYEEILLFNKNNTQKSNYNEFRNLNDIYKYLILITSVDDLKQKFRISNNKPDYLLTGFLIKYYLRMQFKRFGDDELQTILNNFECIKCQIDDKYNEMKKIDAKVAEKYNKPSKIIARILFGSDLDNEKAKWASIIDVSHIYKRDEKYQFRIVCFIPKIITYDGMNIEFNQSLVIETINRLLVDVLENSIKIDETSNSINIFNNLFEN